MMSTTSSSRKRHRSGRPSSRSRSRSRSPTSSRYYSSRNGHSSSRNSHRHSRNRSSRRSYSRSPSRSTSSSRSRSRSPRHTHRRYNDDRHQRGDKDNERYRRDTTTSAQLPPPPPPPLPPQTQTQPPKQPDSVPNISAQQAASEREATINRDTKAPIYTDLMSLPTHDAVAKIEQNAERTIDTAMKIDTNTAHSLLQIQSHAHPPSLPHTETNGELLSQHDGAVHNDLADTTSDSERRSIQFQTLTRPLRPNIQNNNARSSSLSLFADDDDDGNGASFDVASGLSSKKSALFLPPMNSVIADDELHTDVKIFDGDDALKALMNNLAEHTRTHASSSAANDTSVSTNGSTQASERYYADDEGLLDENEMYELGEEKSTNRQIIKGKGRVLPVVDHSSIEYPPFQKNFWQESKSISNMSEDEIIAWRELDMGGVKIRGSDCPRPFKTWEQCGLPTAILNVVEKEYEKPFAVQQQAIPIIMSGRDCLAAARTGSGKTLAYVLPMIRHIYAQTTLEAGTKRSFVTPIAIVLAPARELAVQIADETKKFADALDMRICCCYGGAPIGKQIGALKRGAHIVVATPGRMIELLCLNNGRVLSLSTVTYIVLDEADRMFDMGFGEQISRIIDNVRPDRQMVLFSATFPPSIEKLAKKSIHNGIQLIMGHRSAAPTTVKQIIEIRKAEEKLERLLSIIADPIYAGQILIFVDKQESVDSLTTAITKQGYRCVSIYGSMDQSDREDALKDFKSGKQTILVATSIIARGLDVKDLNLVINYEVPNHYEDYIHRIGRTGRAGKNGTAITFIQPNQREFAPELVKGLMLSAQSVPDDLKAMADEYTRLKREGLIPVHQHNGFGGRGYKFDRAESVQFAEKERVLRLTIDPDVDSVEAQALRQEAEANERERQRNIKDESAAANTAIVAVTPSSSAQKSSPPPALPSRPSPPPPQLPPPPPKTAAEELSKQVAAAKAALAAGIAALKRGGDKSAAEAAALAAKRKADEQAKADAEQRVKAMAQHLSFRSQPQAEAQQTQHTENSNRAASTVTPTAFSAELEINDYSQQARWRVTHRGALDTILEATETAVTTKGSYIPPNRANPENQRKLFFLIEGKSESDVQRCRAEILRILEESAHESSLRGDNEPRGRRYQVLSLTSGER